MRGNRRPSLTVEDDERFKVEEAVREVYVERYLKLAEAGPPLFGAAGGARTRRRNRSCPREAGRLCPPGAAAREPRGPKNDGTGAGIPWLVGSGVVTCAATGWARGPARATASRAGHMP